jgi:hypothetical protein
VSRRAQIEDWLLDLRDFGPDTLSVACSQWRIRENRRPTIADIFKLCAEERELRSPELVCDAQSARERKARFEDRQRTRNIENQREGRALINAWAKAKGYADVDGYIEASGIHWSDAYREHINEVLAGSPIAGGMKAVIGTAAALGVTAREYDPTPEALSEGRRELGMEG